MNEDVKKLKKTIDRLEKQRLRVNAKITEYKSTLQEICNHENVEKQTDYNDGSYYNQAVYTHKQVCLICNKTLHTRKENAGFR